MHSLSPQSLGPILGISELVILLRHRSRANGAVSRDDGSLRRLWVTIGLSITAAYVAVDLLPQAASALLWHGWRVSMVLFFIGLLWRVYAIAYLGRFFTVDVAIAADHRLIDSGPYRYTRHPSYAGLLMEFLGLGISLANWVSLALVIVPTSWMLARRMDIEERALGAALGEAYERYRARTRRLIPGIY